MSADNECTRVQNELLQSTEGGVLSEVSRRHLVACARCSSFRQCLDIAVPAITDSGAPSPELDGKVLAYAAARNRREPAPRSLVFPIVVRFAAVAAAALVISFVAAWLFFAREAGKTTEGDVIADDSTVPVEWQANEIQDAIATTTAAVELQVADQAVLEELLSSETVTEAASDIDRELYALQAEVYFAALSLE